MNTKECVARRKYKTQVFLWKKKKETSATPMDCATLLPAHEVIPPSAETIMTEPSLELAAYQIIVYQHPT